LAGSAAGVAVAVALLASIAAFLSGALATMTTAATRQVAVDWQVEAHRGVDPATVLAAVAGAPHVRAALPVDFGATTGLQATTGGTIQTTGSGVAVGVPGGYGAAFPGELRVLAGDAAGVLLAQQTAANLHAGPGDLVSIGRVGLETVSVRVDGVVDLPQADSLFQTVGAPPGSQASAPPDNVILLPAQQWHAIFDPLAASRPDLVQAQVHARLDHQLPRDPSAAFNQVSGAARNLEVALVGGATVGNNLAAALDGARGDSLYAQILFILLGLPGVALAGLLTATVAATASDRRRREMALMRVRGATVRTMVGLAAAEAAAVALVGGTVGLGAAAIVGRTSFGSATFGASTASGAAWALASVLAGVAIAAWAIVVPARRDARYVTVAAARQPLGRRDRPRWMRGLLDLWLLGASGVIFWLTARAGYKIVLVPEGLPTLSVNYWALTGPLLFWAGCGLLAWRIADALFGPGRRLVAGAAQPVAGNLSGTIAASLSRQRRRLSRPVALVALTVAFAASTAVFNTTYHHQAGVDAVLTNGADVTVSYPGSVGAPGGVTTSLAAVAGVRHVEPMAHRFAYVGADLQDLFGVRASTIVAGAKLQDAYFVGGSARRLAGQLARQPDGILVSAETVKDFQLNVGDQLRLRLRDSGTGQLTEVTFHYLGVAKEFPTAPRDSFLVANADYVAARTAGSTSPGTSDVPGTAGGPGATPGAPGTAGGPGTPGATPGAPGTSGDNTFLLDTGSSSPVSVAERVRAQLGAAAVVTDLVTSRRQVGSSLTAVDLSGLTRVELGFALLLAVAATGLVLGLGLNERRRSFAIARALGARPRQVAAFVRVEAGIITVLGLVLGAMAGWGLAQMLVKILTGVFDPAPSGLTVPWGYLVGMAALAGVAAAAAAEVVVRATRRPVVETIRDL
ncbi:MAG: putative transport system permease protein, partial [Acidimicrobiaceae bacterium]|nr:putative transport system permease protein [Acidimicrobiaceae bacterium]